MNMFSLCRLKGYKNSDLRDKISLTFCRLTPKGLSRFMKWRLGKVKVKVILINLTYWNNMKLQKKIAGFMLQEKRSQGKIIINTKVVEG